MNGEKNNFSRMIQICMLILISGMILPSESLSQDRFVDNKNGTVIDSKNGLMWKINDNGKDVDFDSADIACRESSFAGFTDWRLPDIKELKELYEPNGKNSKGYGITNTISISGCCQWSSYDSTGVSSLLDFRNGKEIWGFKTDSEGLRFLQVRNVN